MSNLQQNLEFIREQVDMPMADDIDSVRGKGAALSGVIGLSAECKKEAKKAVEKARIKAFAELHDKKFPPSVMTKFIDASCADELGEYEYADRLNAAVTHQLDYVRSLISLYKQEMAGEQSASWHQT